MARIIIEDLENDRCEIAEALRILADDIETGYTSGIIGWSSANWALEDFEEEDEEE